MTNYAIELFLTLWAAFSVRQIDLHSTYGIYSGACCNICFLTWWASTQQYGFFTGDLVFTAMYAERIYKRW